MHSNSNNFTPTTMSARHTHNLQIKFILFTAIIFSLSACNFKSSDYKALEAQRDSLMQAQQAMQGEIEGYFATMNQIEQNIETIKSTQNIIRKDSEVEELNEDSRTKINDDLQFILEMVKANKEELERLRKLLRKSSLKSSELERTILRLTKALEEESQKVIALEKELIEKNILIATLGEEIENLTENLDQLSDENTHQKTVIKEQDATIHTAWYVFGTREELKQQKILSSQGIFKPARVLDGDFNKNYFVKIDARKTKSIPLYSTRAKILTSHPKSSYSLEKEDGNYTLVISNTEDFWSISKYLVIEVD